MSWQVKCCAFFGAYQGIRGCKKIKLLQNIDKELIFNYALKYKVLC